MHAQGSDQNKYLALPKVWADIQSVYDEYLKHHPDDEIARNKYAMFCHLSTHWRERCNTWRWEAIFGSGVNSPTFPSTS